MMQVNKAGSRLVQSRTPRSMNRFSHDSVRINIGSAYTKRSQSITPDDEDDSKSERASRTQMFVLIGFALLLSLLFVLSLSSASHILHVHKIEQLFDSSNTVNGAKHLPLKHAAHLARQTLYHVPSSQSKEEQVDVFRTPSFRSRSFKSQLEVKTQLRLEESIEKLMRQEQRQDQAMQDKAKSHEEAEEEQFGIKEQEKQGEPQQPEKPLPTNDLSALIEKPIIEKPFELPPKEEQSAEEPVDQSAVKPQSNNGEESIIEKQPSSSENEAASPLATSEPINQDGQVKESIIGAPVEQADKQVEQPEKPVEEQSTEQSTEGAQPTSESQTELTEGVKTTEQADGISALEQGLNVDQPVTQSSEQSTEQASEQVVDQTIKQSSEQSTEDEAPSAFALPQPAETTQSSDEEAPSAFALPQPTEGSQANGEESVKSATEP